jgi:DNA polymerase-1
MRLPLHPFSRRFNGVYMPIDRPSVYNVRRLDLGCLSILQQMHRNGMEINLPHFAALKKELERGKEVEMAAVESLIGKRINPNSTQQVATLVYKTLGLKPEVGEIRLTESGGQSTDDENLQKVKHLHPVVGHLLKYRELDTLDSNFVTPLPASVSPDGRVRTVFKYTTASTGRLASGDRSTGKRNFQNLPTRGEMGKKIREGFQASTTYKVDGKPVKCVLVSNDLSQIEMVWTAEAAGDASMRQIFINGEDMHDKTACAMFHLDYATQNKKDPVYRTTMRLPAKTMGFLVVYGGGASNLQSQVMAAGGPTWSIDECGRFIERWFQTYPGVREFMDEQVSRARIHGFVWDYAGRVRPIPQSLSAIKKIRNEGDRAAGNMPIQGSAQATIKLAMAEVDLLCEAYREGGKICNPLLQIHDELITEVEEDIAEEFREMVRLIMVNAVELSVPVNASSDVAFTWGGLK